MAAKNTLQFFLGPLLKKFFQDMGRDPNNLEMILLKQKAGQLLKDSNKVINFPQKESFMKQVEAMKKSGDIVNPNDLKKNDNVLTREMFQNSNLNKVARDRDRAIRAKARIEEREKVRNEMKNKYGFTEERLNEIENTPIPSDKEIDDLIRETEPTIEGQMEKITGASNRIKEIQKEIDEMYRPKTDAEIKAKFEKQNKEAAERLRKKMKDEPEDKAEGGRIGFRAGKFVLDKVIAKLLKDKKKVQEAVDDIFGTGDYKMDAEMAADALVENNPQIFKNLLREDLPDEVSSEIYGAVLKPIMSNMAKMRELRKVTKPEKTLQSMKENKTIDMSDPEIADEFTRFMKETDPEGFKKLEQTVELSNFDPKGRKKNAKGGRAGFAEGGGIESRLEQLGGDVTSAEQLLQQINERIQSAESNLGEGAGSGIGSLPTQMPIGQAPNMSPLENAMRGNLPPNNQFNNATLPATLKPATPFAGETFSQDQIPEQYKAGFDEFKKGKIMMGGQAMTSVGLPDGNRVMFGNTGSAGVFGDYLKSIGAMPDNPFGPRQMAPSSGLTNQSPLQQQQNLQTALPGLFAKGGRAGFYTGGIADVEPSLDDIGHGSDSLMARTRLMSPGNQATTSTGLNYLLAEDNDNIRVPFKVGGSGRRDFLKLLATLGGGIAGIKSGLFGMGGKEATKKAVTETVKQTAGSGRPPPYFFKLVEKIKFMGDDAVASQDKAIAKKYKDYVLEEDFAGNISITRRGDMDAPGYEEVYMGYSVDDVPLKGKKGSKKVEEYEEYTVRPDGDGKMKDVEDGVPDEVVNEGSVFEDNMTEFGMTKKADGGRIGFSGGGIFRAIIAKSAARAGMKPYEYIKATSYKSLPPEVKMFMSKADFEKLKMGQEQMYSNYIDMAKTRKNFQEQVEGGKNTPARELFEGMEKTMDEQSFVPKTVTSDDIAEMELMVKNRFNKGRKDNAQGGLQTMLGE